MELKPPMRMLLALWLGKLTLWFLRRLGRGGSALPGRVARAVDPQILTKLSAGVTTLVVTGTNGKTTTAALLAGMLPSQELVYNRAGGNLIMGLTGAFLEAADWRGRVKARYAVLETDEGTMPQACLELRPQVAVVTNLFRDQLDRFGEVEQTAALVRRGLRQVVGTVVLNADDPLTASLGGDAFYGLEAADRGGHAPAFCPNCNQPLAYDRLFYAHVGHWRCPGCGKGRPAVTVAATQLQGSTFRLSTPAGEVPIQLPLPGLYNIYNALAAAAGATALGLPLTAIAKGLNEATGQFGRLERFTIDGRIVQMALVKNPVGFNEVLKTIGGRYFLIAINDSPGDGADVGWLYDVDLEQLGAAKVVASGHRAAEVALRLKYADIAAVAVEADLEQALTVALGQTPPGETLNLLLSYTAMLTTRNLLTERGYAARYWEASQ